MDTPPKRLPGIRQISGGVIVCVKSRDGPLILLLKQNNKRYERTGRDSKKEIIDIGPSGKVEHGERLLQAAMRELRQEIGIDLKIEKNYIDSFSYKFEAIAYEGKFKGKRVRVYKTRKYYLAFASPKQLKRIKLSDEHVSYSLVPIEEAMKTKGVTNPQRYLLKRLGSYLMKN